MSRGPLWNQFRRLFLGTVVEALLAEQIEVEFRSISITFDRESDFRVPRLNNYMRFKGTIDARLPEGLDGAGRPASLQRRMMGAWPEMLKVVDIPIGDRLTSDRNHIQVKHQVTDGGERLSIRFDLIAD
jgi:hypothetical protein